jgi:hypothetical protein
MLAGQKAFAGDGLLALREAVLQGRCAPLSELRPDLPPALLSLVASSMALNPLERPQTAQAMAAALRRATGGDGDASGPHGHSSEAAPTPAAPKRRWGWNWRWGWTGGPAGLLMLGLITGVHSSTRLASELQLGTGASKPALTTTMPGPAVPGLESSPTPAAVATLHT